MDAELPRMSSALHTFPPLQKKTPCFTVVYGWRIRDSGLLMHKKWPTEDGAFWPMAQRM